MELYRNIKKRREQLGMSQDELAAKLGYKDRSTIAKIEQGINDITQSKIAAFAKALETTPQALMGWEEEKPATQGDGLTAMDREVKDVLQSLPEDAQRDALNYMKFLKEKQDKQ